MSDGRDEESREALERVRRDTETVGASSLARVGRRAADHFAGRHAVGAEVLDRRGAKVVQTLKADIGTSSLSVPDPLPVPRTRVSTSIDNGAGGTGGAQQRIIVIHIWYHCPNGSWVHVTIIIWD